MVIEYAPVGGVMVAFGVCFILTLTELYKRNRTLIFPLLLFVCLGLLVIAPYLNPRDNPQHIRNYVNNSRYMLSGVVITNPEFNNSRQQFEVAVRTIWLEGEAQSMQGNIRVSYEENVLAVPYGAEVVFKGYLREIHSFMNPAGFDYERFSALRNIHANLYVRVGDLEIHDPLAYGSGVMRQLYCFKDYVNALVDDNVTGPARGVMQALLTGYRKNIDESVNDAFSKTGLSHVLAISGLHVGIVSLCFSVLFALLLRWIPWLRQNHRLRSAALLLALLPVLVYCVFSGFSPSTKRAFIVLVIFVVGLASLRLQDSFNSTITAALLILLLFPDALYSVSFQLSFGAIFGIIYGYRVLRISRFIPKLCARAGLSKLRTYNERLWRPLNAVFYWLTSCFFMSLFAILTTSPIVMHYFFNTSWSGLLLNLLMIPVLTFIVLPLGMMALLLSWWPWAAGGLLAFAGMCLNFVIEVTMQMAAMSAASGKFFAPTVFEMLCYYVLLFSLFYWLFPQSWHLGQGGFVRARLQILSCRVYGVLIVLSLLGIGVSTTYWIKDRYCRNDVRVTFIDIGQGNATFLEYPRGFNVLIDGGGFRSVSDFDVGQNVLEPFLRHRKVATIDVLILTHGDYDHVGGLFYIVQNFKVRQVYLPDFESTESLAFMETLRAADVPYSFITQGQTLTNASGFKMEVLNPPPDIHNNYLRKKPDVNDCSLVLKVNCAGKSILFTGDIGKQVEKYLTEKYGGFLQSDIILAPHHGSKNSNTVPFVEVVNPKFVVFSVGYNNYYNFPNPAVVSLYADAGTRVLQTGLMGAVEFRFGVNEVKLKTYRHVWDK